MTIPETWESIEGYAGYEVSNRGRVRSFNGRWNKDEYILQPHYSNEYPQVSLHNADGQRTFNIHTLVMRSFVGIPPEGMEICHNDCDPSNNTLSNLRYDSHSSNMRQRNQASYARRFSSDTVIQIRKQRADGEQVKVLASHYETTMSNISHICTGKYYKHIGGPLTKTRLSDDDVIKLRIKRANGATLSEVAEKYQTTIRTASRLSSGKSRANIGGPFTIGRASYRS